MSLLRESARRLATSTGLGLITGGAVTVALLLLSPDYFYHWDEIQLRLGVDRFDLTWHQPHPPGYYLFIVAARLIRFVAGWALPVGVEPTRLVSILATAVVATFVIARLPNALAVGTRALFAVAFLCFILLSPVVAFFSLTGLTSAAESCLWLLLLWGTASRPRGRRLVALAAGIGLCGGVRQTLLVWGVLLVAIEWARDREWLRARELVAPAGALVLGVAVWLVPAVIESGGWETYAATTRSVVLGNIWSKSIFVAGIDVTAQRFAALASDLWVSIGVLLGLPIVAVIARLRGHPSAGLRRLDTLLLGAAISFVFYVLLIYDSSGYAMSSVLPLCAYGFVAVAELAVGVAVAVQIRLAAGLLIGAVTLAVFPLGPEVPGAHGRLAIHDRQLARRFAAVRQRFAPASTLLVTSREYWAYGLRHVAYYLPEYPTLQLSRDPFITGLGEETPYLMGQAGRVWGSAGSELTELVRRGDDEALRWVVYMVPDDAAEFIAPSCRPHVRGLDIGEEERLAVIELSAALSVRVVDERLVCSAQSEPEEEPRDAPQ